MDILRNCFKNVFRKKLRSGLTILGIAIGVFSVVIITAIGDIGKFAISAELDSLGMEGVSVTTSAKTADSKLNAGDLNTLLKDTSYIENATPIIAEFVTARMKGLDCDVVTFGVDQNASQAIALELLCGRLISKADVASSAKVCVVDEAYAQEIYKRTNIVGKKVSLLLGENFEQFEIVGVVASGGNILQGLMGDVVPTFLYTPYTAMQDVGTKQYFDQIAVRIRPDVNSQDATDRIARLLTDISRPKNTIRVENLSAQKQTLSGILGIISNILTCIGAISLLVAGISIMTVMLVSVNERTREIGIKKSIGAGKYDILLEFMLEAVIISLIGALIGAGVSLACLYVACLLLGFPFVINTPSLLFCVLFSLAMGVIFGIYPAYTASKLKPVDALRCE